MPHDIGLSNVRGSRGQLPHIFKIIILLSDKPKQLFSKSIEIYKTNTNVKKYQYVF